MVDYRKWDAIEDTDSEEERNGGIISTKSLSFNSSDDDVQAARTLRTEGNILFDKAIETTNTNGEILLAAVEKYESAIRLVRDKRGEPGVEVDMLLPCHLNCATAAVKLERYDMGLQHSNAALEISGSHPRALYIHGYCERESGNWFQAQTDWDIAVKEATRLGELESYEELLENQRELQSLIDEEMLSVKAAMNEGITAAHAKDFSVAASKLDKVLCSPVFPMFSLFERLKVSKITATSCLAICQFEKAKAALNMAERSPNLNLRDHTEILLIKGNLLFKERQTEKALEVFSSALKMYQSSNVLESPANDEEKHNEPIFVLDADGNMVPEMHTTSKNTTETNCSELERVGATLSCNIGLCLLKLKLYPEAVAELLKIEENPSLTRSDTTKILILKALEGLGDAFAFQGEFSLAREKTLKLRNLSKEWDNFWSEASALQFLAELEMNEGDIQGACLYWNEAIALCRKCLKPDHKVLTLQSNTHFKMANAIKTQGGRELLDKAADEFAKSAKLLMELRGSKNDSVMCADQTGLLRELESWFLAGSLLVTTDCTNAEDYLRKCLAILDTLSEDIQHKKEIKQKKAECLQFLAMSIAKQNRFDAAEHYVDKAKELYVEIEDRHSLRGLHKASAIMYFRQHQYDKAQAAIQAALDNCIGPCEDAAKEEKELLCMLDEIGLKTSSPVLDQENKAVGSLKNDSLNSTPKSHLEIEEDDLASRCILA